MVLAIILTPNVYRVSAFCSSEEELSTLELDSAAGVSELLDCFSSFLLDELEDFADSSFTDELDATLEEELTVVFLLELDLASSWSSNKSVLESGELAADSVVAFFATTAADGKNYNVAYYNLDMIISVGYRVNSHRGVQFRIWATNVLKNSRPKATHLCT